MINETREALAASSKLYGLMNGVDVLQDAIAELKYDVEEFLDDPISSRVTSEGWRALCEDMKIGPLSSCLSEEIKAISEMKMQEVVESSEKTNE